MNITSDVIKELRDQTGVGLMDCKKALSEAGGNLEKAIDILRKKGLALAAKKASREASEGVIGSYIHMDKIGVLVEVNCETDFVAMTDAFRELVKNIAMHIAASSPAYLKREDVPSDVIDKEKSIYSAQIKDKPLHVVEKIVEGKLEKFYTDTCLMDQVFIKDQEQKKRVKDIVTETVARLGENIIVKRFVRFQLGEKKTIDET
ncbi:MAG: translation elongation factor Ts [Thermodesulfovibrionia bacterium]|nr:translation elongation factor Ts [Thermodesulfovibrionia bacterium]MCK5512274.1 translation elongation factor Ts [Thermodesulfovibrionia bacterium]